MNSFKYSDTNKRYHTLSYAFKQKFNHKVGRVPINAGFTCPNIDGTKSFGGCTFCSIKGSGDYAGESTDSLEKQWINGLVLMRKKWPEAKYIAYFQAFTNTYAPVEILKEKYEYFAKKSDCVGISIGTRPDCLDDDVIEYLGELNKRCYLIVELGLQTMHDQTGLLINRCHDTKSFDDAVTKLRSHNIEVVAHIINGLPKEDHQMMLQTAKHVAQSDVQGVKIHLLHVVHGTAMVNQLNNGFLQLMEQEQYVNLVCDQLEVLPPEMVIHRVTGDAPVEEFIGPIWSRFKTRVMNDIDKELVRRESYQGASYDSK